MSETSPRPKMKFFGRLWFFFKLAEIRLRFILILALSAVTIGYWDHIVNYYERWERRREAAKPGASAHADAHPDTAESAPGESSVEFFCPMHPFVIRARPDKCPLCGMDLSERKKGETMALPEGVAARVQLSPERILQAGVRTEAAQYRLLSRTIQSYGVLEPDESRVARITQRFPGRIEELLVNTTGAEVQAGEALARIYSPKYLAASEEYAQAAAQNRQTEQDAKASAAEKRRSAAIAAYSRQRLQLAGFTAGQLDEIAEKGHGEEIIVLHSPIAGTILEKNAVAGDQVEEGAPLYTVADLSRLWAQVKLLESDIAAARIGMAVEISAVAWPGELFYGNIDFIYPSVNIENRSVNVRVGIENSSRKLKPGMFATATLRSPIGRVERLKSEAAAEKTAEEKTNSEESPSTAGAASALLSPPAASARSIKLPTHDESEAKTFLTALALGAEYWVCPMHPEVVSPKKDNCPKCGMFLEKTQKKQSIPAIETAEQNPGEPPSANPSVESSMKSFVESSVYSDDSIAFASASTWAEGWTCEMHPDLLQKHGGRCEVCGCGMKLGRWRVERVLSVPESAVIDAGTRQIVYVETMPGVFDGRLVKLGPRAGAYYPVLGGLSAGEKIALRGAFLIDAEARLNPAASGYVLQP